MSKISLKHSGGNVVSLNSPTSAPTSADVAFKLPNADGTSGQALVTDASGNLSFAGTGKILQVVQTVKTDTFSYTGTTNNTDITGMSVNITPSSSSNKVLIFAMLHVSQQNIPSIYLVRDSTLIGIGDASGSRPRATARIRSSGDTNTSGIGTIVFLDSPNTTSQVTYKLQASLENAAHNLYVNRSEGDLNSAVGTITFSTITVQEVAA